jgi:hypothetical protein
MSDGLPMESRRVRLGAPSPALLDRIFEGAISGEFPWIWRGTPETPVHFDEALWGDVLAQYAIIDRATGEHVGLVGAFGANPFHRFCYTTMTLLPEHRRKVWPFEGVLLFGNLLYTKYDMENVYAETTGTYYEEFKSGAGRLFDELGRFPGRLLVNRQREDFIITGMSREQWEAKGLPLLRAVLP